MGSRATSSPSDTRGSEENRAGLEMLKEQFETLAAQGDIRGVATTATMLNRGYPDSVYVAREVPRIMMLTYVRAAKNEFAGGQVNASLETLRDGRRKFGRSPELRNLEVRYVAAADVYDRLSNAVALNVNDTVRSLDELKASEGDEYPVAAQMLAQTLADRIADQRAANRDAVADKLTEAGKRVFPEYAALLNHGRPGVLPATQIMISDQGQ